jgi:hypothetical protein
MLDGKDNMIDREFYTADGRDWFEPRPEELREETTEIRTTSMHHTCMTCGKDLVPQMLVCVFERTRTWTHTGGISGVYSDWSKWKVIGWKCLNGCNFSNIPF